MTQTSIKSYFALCMVKEYVKQNDDQIPLLSSFLLCSGFTSVNHIAGLGSEQRLQKAFKYFYKCAVLLNFTQFSGSAQLPASGLPHWISTEINQVLKYSLTVISGEGLRLALYFIPLVTASLPARSQFQHHSSDTS